MTGKVRTPTPTPPPTLSQREKAIWVDGFRAGHLSGYRSGYRSRVRHLIRRERLPQRDARKLDFATEEPA